MTLRGFEKRLSSLNSVLPKKADPEAQAAFLYVISHLDSLAARKASGDPMAQSEIERICDFMKGGTG